MSNTTRRQSIGRVAAATLLPVVGAVLLLALFSSPAWAEPDTLFVSSSGSGAACTQASPCDLQTALGRAGAGDTIYVAQGTYTGAGEAVLDIDVSVTLCGGWNGAASGPIVRDPQSYRTILNGETVRRVVSISGNITPTVDGFTITGGNAATAPQAAGQGGGVYSTGASPVIVGNTITGNVAYSGTSGTGYGGGIYVALAPRPTVITGNAVISNVASTSYHGLGGGIYLTGAPSAQVVNNVVLSNTASITGGLGHGGGIGLSGSGNTLLTGNQVEHNVGQGGPATLFGSEGGGIYCQASDDVTISNNTVRYNTSSVAHNGNGGAIGLWGCDGMTVEHNTLLANVASEGTMGGTGRGGAFTAYSSAELILEGNWILSNTATLGGGLYLLRNTTFTMTNNVVAANAASYQGGGMAFETGGGEPVYGTLMHNTFVGNNLGTGDGRIGIHVNDTLVTLVLTNNLICTHTHGIYVTAGSTATLNTTLFYANPSGSAGGPGAIVNTAPLTGQAPRLDEGYHLRAGSPAIDAAVPVGVLTDVDGDARPQDGDIDRTAVADIGADEFAVRRIYLPVAVREHSQ